MQKLILFLLLPLFFATPLFSQFATEDNLPLNSGCRVPYTYPSGFNLSIAVSSLDRKKETEAEIERTLALDISRFKDTGLVRTQGDTPPPSGKWPLGFMVTIFWSELKVGDKPGGYVASLFYWEECATFNDSHSRGFSIRELTISGPYFAQTKEKLEDFVEKDIYDSVGKIVKARREAAKSD